MPRGLFSPRRMKRVWASAERSEIARQAKASKQRKEAGVQKGVRAHQDEQREKQELRKWNEQNRPRPTRSAEEQRRRIESATGVHRGSAERVERPKPATPARVARFDRTLSRKGAANSPQKGYGEKGAA